MVVATEPATEEPVVEEPATEEPTAEAPAAESTEPKILRIAYGREIDVLNAFTSQNLCDIEFAMVEGLITTDDFKHIRSCFGERNSHF